MSENLLKAATDIIQNFKVYEFEDCESEFGKYLINEKNPEKIKKNLEEYKKEVNGEIVIEEFIEFLQNKGYIIIALDSDHYIYF